MTVSASPRPRVSASPTPGLTWSRAEQTDRRARLRAAFARGLRPPPRMAFSAWCEANLVLPKGVAADPGPLSFRETPYIRGPLDAFGDADVERITLISSTQVGKTTIEICMLAGAADFDPGPALSVQPNDDFARSLAVERVIPVFRASPNLARRLPKGRGLTSTQIVLDSAPINFASARSAADLASRAIRYLILGEPEEYPPDTGKGGSPQAQAEERTRTFWNRKIYESTTPKHELGFTWRSWERACQHFYFVPCPHCGTVQALSFDGRGLDGCPGPFGRIEWPKDDKGHPAASPDEIQHRLLACYVCGSCGATWEEKDKKAIVASGEWRCVTPGRSRRHVGYHLWAAYSPWLTFSEIAAKHLRERDYPELLPVFVNKWLARPFKEEGEKPKAEAVLARRREGYGLGQVPADVRFLVAAVDIHATLQYWMVWGWGVGFTGWLIAAGREDIGVDPAGGWECVFQACTRGYPRIGADGKPTGELLHVGFPAGMAMMDCGWDKPDDPEENVDEWHVIELCDEWNYRVRGPLFQPSKGGSSRGGDYLNWSRAIDRDQDGKPLRNRLTLHRFNPWFFKKMFYRRLQTPGEVGGIWLPKDLSRAVMDQLLAEEMVTLPDGSEEWNKLGPNHWFDTSIQCLAAAWKSRTYLESPPPAPTPAPSAPEPSGPSRFQRFRNMRRGR